MADCKHEFSLKACLKGFDLMCRKCGYKKMSSNFVSGLLGGAVPGICGLLFSRLFDSQAFSWPIQALVKALLWVIGFALMRICEGMIFYVGSTIWYRVKGER